MKYPGCCETGHGNSQFCILVYSILKICCRFNMNRRKTIKQLVIAGGGLITLPQWIVSCGISDSPTHQTLFSQGEQELISSVVDTIIPAGNPIAIGSTGALSVGVDKYLIKLIDDCLEKEVQDNVKAQLNALSTSAQSLHHKSFVSCPQEE